MKRLGLGLLGLSVLACGGLDRIDTGAVVVAPVAEEAAATEGAATEDAYAGVPGWLGLATIDGIGAPFTPRTSAGLVAVPWGEHFASVSPGTAFTGWSRGGPVGLTFTGVQTLPMGCDDTPTEMALFDAEAVFPEGPVWITADTATNLVVRPIRDQGTPTPTSRSLVSDDLHLDFSASGTEGVLTLSVETVGVQLSRGIIPFEVHPMDGAEPTLDLTNADQVFAPWPVARYDLGAETLLVTRAYSWEGVRFQVWRLGDTPEPIGSEYLYLCAF